MAEHTPGPWLFVDNDQEDEIWDSNHVHMLAWINPKATQHSDEWKSNARLIAAAPEMLDRLSDAYKALIGAGLNWNSEFMRNIHAAIYKAT